MTKADLKHVTKKNGWQFNWKSEAESAPFNFGKPKLYEGVPGNLVAFACKESRDKGYEGCISFTSKTKLIGHYEKTLGAVHLGNHRMVIYPNAAEKLINRYFNTK